MVASVPADHVYIRHLSPLDRPGPVRLADPDPDDPGRAAQQRWWPPAMLEPSWVRTHEFDLLHLHFGFDAREPADLEAFMAALRDRGRPLVFTVHDLRNPHHRERGLHDAQLDVLVPAADELITLTPGAADEIERRWGRAPTVVPHPHVAPLDDMAELASLRTRRRSPEFRVGLHVKSLRASMDPMAVLPVLVEAVGRLPGAVLQVDAHLDTGLDRELEQLCAPDHVDLRMHDFYDDEAFLAYLASLDASVLPYRFGTHSGWLEACRDVGTTVITSTCGYYAEQGPVLSYRLDEDAFDRDGLVAALVRAFEERPAWGTTVEERRRQREAVADTHDAVYRAALDGR